MKLLIKVLATVCFIGYMPIASGTFGSVAGVAVWMFASTWKYYPFVVLLIISIGFIASNYAERKIFLKEDPPEVVIDEMAGMLISYLLYRFAFDIKSLLILILGFVVFRFFDILKPQPIKVVQRLPGGIGIMADDIIAGGFTLGILYLFRFIL